MKNTFLIIYICMIPGIFHAQESQQSINQFIADIFEQYSEETGEEPDFESFQDDLLQLSESSVNLNSTTREELDKIPFLSDQQIENLMYYLYKTGGMSNLFELQLVEGFDMTDIRRMLPFIKLEGVNKVDKFPELYEIFRYGKNEIYLRFDHQFEKRKGFLSTNNDGPQYQGTDFYHYFKYKFHHRDRVQFSLVAENDVGENFFNKANKGYDFYSASLQIKNSGIIQNLIAGDFRASFGQGLIIRQGGGITGKSMVTTSLINTSQGFKKYSSVNETDFLRGTAVSLGFKKLQIHAFFSDKMIDGNFTDDVFRSVLTSGYHRTNDEIMNKANVNQIVTGLGLVYTNLHWQIGLTSVYSHFSDSLNPLLKPYNTLYFRGKNNLITGLNYRLRIGKFNFFGEVAINHKSAFAILSGITFSPMSRINLAWIYRNYSADFDNSFASAFSENSDIINERACYTGVELIPFRKWKISAYADIYTFPWLRFGTDFPSSGSDFLLYTQYNPDRYNQMNWKLKYEKVQTNQELKSANISGIGLKEKISLRYQLQHHAGNLIFKTTVEANLVHQLNPSYGFAAWQDIGYKTAGFPFSIDLRVMFFDAPDYLNRIYAYENDVLYAFSIPAFSGTGSRYLLSMCYDISENLTCWFRIAQYAYADDREATGGGNDLIPGNKKTDFRFLLRWKFPTF